MVEIPSHLFACTPHWKQLSRALQQALYREYRPGQNIGEQTPTTRYLAVQHRAIAFLAFKPNDEEAAKLAAQYLLNSWRLRLAAIRSGEGDPLPKEALPPSTTGIGVVEEEDA